MKRVKYACLLQTLHFVQKEDGTEHSAAVQNIQEEVAHYKSELDRSHTKYQISAEKMQPDGSVLLEIRRQYNSYDCGDYIKTSNSR